MKFNKTQIKQKVSRFLRTRPEVKFAYLFGSVARNEDNRLSDVDIAIFIDPSFNQEFFPYGYKAKIITDLMQVLKTNDIDLVILNESPCLLRHRVIRDGIVIYARNDEERLAFHVKTVDEYLDLKQFLKVSKLN